MICCCRPQGKPERSDQKMKVAGVEMVCSSSQVALGSKIIGNVKLKAREIIVGMR